MDRFVIQAREYENEVSICYRAQDTRHGIACILRELFPADPSNRAILVEFDRIARTLIQARPRFLVATTERFTKDSRFFTVEEYSAMLPLRDRLKHDGPLDESHAWRLWKILLETVRELNSTSPPLYLGNLDAGRLLVTDEPFSIRVRDPGCLLDAALRHRPRTLAASLEKDLADVAWVVAEALSDIPAEKLREDGHKAARVVRSVESLELRVLLEWALLCPEKPRTIAAIDDVCGLLRRSAGASGPDRAECLRQAYALCNTPSLASAMDRPPVVAMQAVAAQLAPRAEPAPSDHPELRARLYRNRFESKDRSDIAATVTVYGDRGTDLADFATELADVLDQEMIKADGPLMLREHLPSLRFHFLSGHPKCVEVQRQRVKGTPEPRLSLEELARWLRGGPLPNHQSVALHALEHDTLADPKNGPALPRIRPSHRTWLACGATAVVLLVAGWLAIGSHKPAIGNPPVSSTVSNGPPGVGSAEPSVSGSPERGTVHLAGIRFTKVQNGKGGRRYLLIHGNEETARTVVEDHIRAHQGIAYLVQSLDRFVPFGPGRLDPNRMFSREGAEKNFRLLNSWSPSVLRSTLDELDRGRGELLQAFIPPTGGLLVALHNTSNHSVRNELPLSNESSLSEPSIPSDFLLCTDRRDFQRLAQSPYNAVLQESPPRDDDGSLSRLAAAQRFRYVNIESKMGSLTKQKAMLSWVETNLP